MLWVICTTLVLRVVRGTRPFPSLDDFTYVPLAWAARDAALFTRDTLLRGFVHHTPAWNLIVAALDHTTGEAIGFWLLTLLLSCGTVAALLRLMRATGVTLTLLPVVAAVAFCGPVSGFGRGAYDGALGDGFHMQWLALCAVLWSYEAYLRGRPIAAGAWLGGAALAHPVVAAHAATALTIAYLITPGRRWRELWRTAAVALLVSLPVSLLLAGSLLKTGSEQLPAWTPQEIVRLGYLFRAPHHYDLGATPMVTWLYLGTMVLGGLAAALVARPEPHRPAVQRLTGLLAGQAVVGLGAMLLYGEWLPERWRLASVVPYLLDLSRSSGLLLPLAAVLVAGAVELRPGRRSEPISREVLWLGLLVLAVTALVFFVRWQPLLLAVVAVALLARAAGGRSQATMVIALCLAAFIAVGVVRLYRTTVLREVLTPDEAGLYRWAAGTSSSALFVIPPGMQAFRFYARRSVYVDFKLFPPATPAATPEWRRRLELVAAPDRLALASPGWAGVAQWDRTYANRNTPARIASLLQTTQADYVVWDRAGLEVPPFVPVARPSAGQAKIVYANARFEVYALPGAGDDAAGR